MKLSVKKMLFSFLLLISGLYVQSASAMHPEKMNEAIIKKLKNDTNQFTGNKAIVYVSFYISPGGQVVVQEVNGSDSSSRDFVKARLQEMNAADLRAEAGKTYCFKISFNKV